MALLRIIDGFDQGLRRELGSGDITIGRDPSNHIQISDPKASRTHVRIVSRREGGHDLIDCDSSNGTWSDTGRITKMRLQSGSLFRIGSTYFEYLQAEGDSNAGTLADEQPGWRDPVRIEGLERGHGFLTATHADAGRLQRANRYLALLYSFVLRSGECHGREELFELLDDLASDALEGDRCAVFLPTAEGWALWPPHERRLRARFGSVPYARTLLRQVRETPQPMLASADERALGATVVRAGVAAAMAVPLRSGERVHGLLYVDRLAGQRAFDQDELEFLVAVGNQLTVRLLDDERLAALDAEVTRLRQVAAQPAPPAMLGSSYAMQAVRRFIDRASESTAPVLVLGPSGSGKDLVCQHLHHNGPRAHQPLQRLHVAAMPPERLDEALFGSADGQPGLLELADGGALVIDELTALPVSVQARLVHVLDSGELHRVGDAALRRVDIRLYACSADDVDQAELEGRLLSELRHRLEVMRCSVPALADHPEDLLAHVDAILEQAAEHRQQPIRRLSDRVRGVLLGYHWPGNVRQLHMVLDRCLAMAEGSEIQMEDLPESVLSAGAHVADGGEQVGPPPSLAEVERDHILRVLEHCGGNKKASAEILGIDRSTLYAKLRQYG